MMVMPEGKHECLNLISWYTSMIQSEAVAIYCIVIAALEEESVEPWML